MTQLTQTQRRNPTLALAGVAIVASMLGGVVGTRVQAIVDGAAAQQAQAAAAEQANWDAYGADWLRLNQAQQNRYPLTRDQAVLKGAQEWEARERQMYPISTSTRYSAVLKGAQEWEARERQMYPNSN